MLGRIVGVGLDRAFVRFAFRGSRSTPRAVGRTQFLTRLDEAAALYAGADARGRLFVEPDLPRPIERRVKDIPGGEAVDLAWPSAYDAVHDAYRRGHDRYPENGTVYARWFRHRGASPRAALVCLHGWGAGRFGFEEIAFSVRGLYALGIDLVLGTLPFHARRAPPGLRAPVFPSVDPVWSNEGFAQAVSDLRGLVALLRARGAPAVGVCGMSLGGFTTALLATVPGRTGPVIDVAVPIIPFASLADLMWEHGEGTRARQRAEQAGVTQERFSAAFAATTPTRRRPVVPPERILIVAGEHDRVTPPAHAERLRDHFAAGGVAPRYVTFAGSHLVQTGRREAFRALAKFLGERGLLPPRA